MKKEAQTNKVAEHGKRAAKRVATYYANVACPLVVYQPKMKESVRKLRKF